MASSCPIDNCIYACLSVDQGLNFEPSYIHSTYIPQMCKYLARFSIVIYNALNFYSAFNESNFTNEYRHMLDQYKFRSF